MISDKSIFMTRHFAGAFKRLYSTAHIARLLSIDVSTVKRWADSGKLQCYRTVGGHRRFRLDQVQAFIAGTYRERMSSLNSVTEPDVGRNRQ